MRTPNSRHSERSVLRPRQFLESRLRRKCVGYRPFTPFRVTMRDLFQRPHRNIGPLLGALFCLFRRGVLAVGLMSAADSDCILTLGEGDIESV